MKQVYIIFLGFVTITAFIGGVMLILSPDGKTRHLSSSILHDGLFRDFRIPGYALSILVGGTCLIALTTTLLHLKNSNLLSLLAAINIIGWIGVQMVLTNEFYFLQFIYLAQGIFILFFAWSEMKKHWNYN